MIEGGGPLSLRDGSLSNVITKRKHMHVWTYMDMTVMNTRVAKGP